ncbi:MAG: hypothetical protein DCF16_04350 [Alphaproteobacteria bacterium]|nr:MAG: hypothetical protein DCF16_04350 [Alphaproteobacteria bacterium]
MLARLIASVLLITAALTGAASAQDGRWWRAESANFIVYGDLNEQQVRNAAQSLEDFDLVLRALTRLESRENQNKLEVFLVRNLRGLRVVAPHMSESVGGFYIASGDMIAAFSRYDRDLGIDRRTILFHEYAHHFMLHYFPSAYPQWYIEGWAEYVSTTDISRRRATIGRPSENRSSWLNYGDPFPVEHLLAPESVAQRDGEFTGRFYAYSWFAVNYLSNTSERLRGLERYVSLLGEGGGPLESFEPAFGITAQQFGEELEAFKDGRSRLLHIDLPQELAPMTVNRLPRAADNMLLPLARLRTSQSAVNDEDAAEISAAAQPHLDDPMARILLARLAIRRGDNAGARDQLNALFAQEENHAEGRYLLADMILEEMNAKSGEEARADLTEARRHLVRSFRQDPSYYPTLYLYASTFAGEPQPMSDEQLNVLGRALELAPQADHIRLLLARELIRSEEYDNAAALLRPVLYAPHGGDQSAYARWLFDAARLRAPPSGDWQPPETQPAAAGEP